MRKLTFVILLCMTGLYCQLVHAQTQGIQWKKIIGNKKLDDFRKIVPALDGGYLLIGEQEPLDTNNWRPDLRLVKVNKVGAVEWEKTYGGSKEDWGITGIATADGGFMVVGGTCSVNNDGDVTGHHGLDPNAFLYYPDEQPQDIWVLKISASGDLVWEKPFGGSNWDEGHDIIKTSDNNYMIVGQSSSRDGDLTGMRRSNIVPGNTDNSDMWVFKIDENGNLLWQKCYGGNNDDNANCVIEVPNGYLLGGWTNSNDLDVSGLHASYYTDAWVLSIDKTGGINWSKPFGGSKSDNVSRIVSHNSNYLVAGSTNSKDGDVVGFHPSTDTINPPYDMWLFEMSSAGNLNWQNTIGTTDAEFVNDMAATTDGVTIIGNDQDYNHGKDIPLVIKTDYTGNIIYQRTYNYLNGLDFNTITPVDANNYYITGDIIPQFYKVPGDHLYGSTDGVLIKFGDINSIAGKVFIDANANNTYDSGEQLLNGIKVTSSKAGYQYSSFTSAGIYSNDVDTGNYTTLPQFNNQNYIISPVNKASSFTTYFNTDSIDFALTPVAGRNDLSVVIIPQIGTVPGYSTIYKLMAWNQGTTTQDAVLKLVKDSRLSIESSAPAATVVNDTLSWQFTSLKPFDTVSVRLVMRLAAPPVLNIGDTLTLISTVFPVAGDFTPGDNVDTLKQVVKASYDPNDKTESHGGIITPAEISGAEPLTYVIRFQNTGTDTAYNITVRDTLESRLDWSSLQMISSSHPYQLSIEDGNKLTWQFNGIKLPFDEPSSHGYIAYRIKPLSTVHAGDTIKNTAGIYFDFNLPVATNINKTVVFLPSSALPVTLLSFQAAQAGSIVNVSWKTSAELNAKYFEVQRSANGIDFTTIGTVPAGNTTYQFKDNSPITGYNYYRLKPVDIDGRFTYSTFVMVNMKSGAEVISSLYPNPGNGNVTLKLKGTVQGNVMVQVLDQQGREVVTKQFGVQNTGEFKTPLDLGKLSKGSYILRIVVDSKMYLQKLLIQ